MTIFDTKAKQTGANFQRSNGSIDEPQEEARPAGLSENDVEYLAKTKNHDENQEDA